MAQSWGVLEAASWRLGSELHRRHPDVLRLRLEQPVGGGYDCLTLRSDGGADIELSRSGRIHVLAKHGGGSVSWRATKWKAYLGAADPRVFVDALSAAAGLEPGPTPPSTPAVLVHRTVSALTSLAWLSEPLRVEPGEERGDFRVEATWVHAHLAADGTVRNAAGATLSLPATYDEVGRSGHRLLGRVLAHVT